MADDMVRDYVYSFAGHIAVIGGLAVAAQFTVKAPPPMVDIYQVQAVSSQSVADLIQRVEQVSQPRPAVPQIRAPEPALPQEHRKEAQPVKRSEPVNAEPAVTNKPSETPTVQGIRTDTVFDYPEYLLALQARISSNWNYPSLTTDMQTRVFFRIMKNGEVTQVRVEQRTGNMTFDASAQRAVITSVPFPPLPEGYEEDNLGVHFDFIYKAN